MATVIADSHHIQLQTRQQIPKSTVPLLDQRFAKLKQSLVKPEHKQKVIDSFSRLCNFLEKQADLIQRNGPEMVPSIDFGNVLSNDGKFPADFANVVRERGCVILRNVVPEEQASAWEAQLKDYTQRHKTVGGFPLDNPQNWSLWWTPAQVQIRSHPRVLQAMDCVSQLWHVSDPTLPVDLNSQVDVVYVRPLLHP